MSSRLVGTTSRTAGEALYTEVIFITCAMGTSNSYLLNNVIVNKGLGIDGNGLGLVYRHMQWLVRVDGSCKAEG